MAGVLEGPERLCAVQRLKLLAMISNLPPGVPVAVGGQGMLRTMRVREWRWNADARRWELADTGEEFELGGLLTSVPLPGPVGLLALGAGLIAAIVRWARHRSQAS